MNPILSQKEIGSLNRKNNYHKKPRSKSRAGLLFSENKKSPGPYGAGLYIKVLDV
jgi:hypothetical protein